MDGDVEARLDRRHLDGRLASWVAEEQKSVAAVMQQQRQWTEEQEADQMARGTANRTSNNSFRIEISTVV